MTYALDFDGVLFKDGEIDAAVAGRIQELRAGGDKIILHTSRKGTALKNAEEALTGAGIELDGITGGKLYADYYIDDRALSLSDFLGEEKRSMTPNDRIKFKDAAQARAVVLSLAPALEKRLDSEFYVEGYATTYEPYLLYDDGDFGKTYERFEPGCFDTCDMSDIIMQFDHAGRVFARNTNGTLIVEPDGTGLFTAADLGRTEGSRALHEDISAGLITKMSWRFRIGDYHVERTEGSKDITIVHTRIAKIYDVSAVSIPANDNSSINARDFISGVRDEVLRRERALEERRRKLALKIKINT